MLLRRRSVVALAGLWLGAAAVPRAVAVPAAPADRVPVVRVGSDAYMLPGLPGEPDAGNLGRVGNAGFIVGRSGVIAIDTGTSYRHGTALLAAIARTTDRPIRLALITHTRQEFLFGAAAYRERGIPIAMQAEAAGLMASRCDNCLKGLRQLLGDEAMAGTTMFKADQAFTDPQQIDASALIGRPVQLLYFGHSSGPGDVAVFDRRSGVLFAGGLADRQRIPDIGDSDLPGWQNALRALQALPIKVVVPGHGRAGPAATLADTAHYLAQLQARVASLLHSDTPLSEVPDATDLPEFERWDQYDTVHRRNAAIAFLRLEREQLLK
jgi:glyoxylase-like metal-dependent hydrolase (beta-lactamase superfamily II)